MAVLGTMNPRPWPRITAHFELDGVVRGLGAAANVRRGGERPVQMSFADSIYRSHVVLEYTHWQKARQSDQPAVIPWANAARGARRDTVRVPAGFRGTHNITTWDLQGMAVRPRNLSTVLARLRSSTNARRIKGARRQSATCKDVDRIEDAECAPAASLPRLVTGHLVYSEPSIAGLGSGGAIQWRIQ